MRAGEFERLSDDEYLRLAAAGSAAQAGRCYLCAEPLDEGLARGDVSLDRIPATEEPDADDAENLVVSHAGCSHGRLAPDLPVARALARFQRLQATLGRQPGRPNLADVLALAGGARFDLPFSVDADAFTCGFPDLGRPEPETAPLLTDALSGMRSVFLNLPLAYLTHDDRINPRAIALPGLKRMIEEFRSGLPQLQVALGWLATGDERAAVHIFDGQHKLAAQALLGVEAAPVRVFIDPDLDTLLMANAHAGTRLRQVAFDRLAQRRLGKGLLDTRVRRFLADFGLPADFRAFSERGLAAHFRTRRAEVRRETLDALRDAIVRDPANRLTPYIDLAGDGAAPLAYGVVERTIFALCLSAEQAPLSHVAEEGEDPRAVETEQTVQLMNLLADRLFAGRFQPEIGARRLERRLAAGEAIPAAHIVAVRIAREEPQYALIAACRAAALAALTAARPAPVDATRLLQYRLPAAAWQAVAAAIARVLALPFWTAQGEAAGVFSERRPRAYWSRVIAGGTLPDEAAAAPAARARPRRAEGGTRRRP